MSWKPKFLYVFNWEWGGGRRHKIDAPVVTRETVDLVVVVHVINPSIQEAETG